MDKKEHSTLQTLRLALAATGVKRYHTRHTLIPQNNAEHSFNVAWFCWALEYGAPSAALLLAALAHDVPEHITGDVPAHTKRRPEVKKLLDAVEKDVLESAHIAELPILTPREQVILGIADTLDLLAHCQKETCVGNTLVADITKRGIVYLKDKLAAGMEQRVLGADDRRNVLNIYHALESDQLLRAF